MHTSEHIFLSKSAEFSLILQFDLCKTPLGFEILRKNSFHKRKPDLIINKREIINEYLDRLLCVLSAISSEFDMNPISSLLI